MTLGPIHRISPQVLPEIPLPKSPIQSSHILTLVPSCGCWPVRFAALTLSVLLIASCASRAFQEERPAGIFVPSECLNGYGAQQLLNGPVARNRLEKSSNQHYEHGLELYSSGDKTGAAQEFREAAEE